MQNFGPNWIIIAHVMASTKKSLFLNALVISSFSLGCLSLLALAYSRGVLSLRQLAGGMLVWMVCPFFLARFLAKRTAQSQGISSGQPATPVDDVGRKRILRAIRTRKIWIGVLAVCLPLGIASAITHRAYLPLLTGGAMNLLLMYVAKEDIKRLKKRLTASLAPH